MGCSFGQILWKLASDSVPSDRLYGSDFFELGYKLLRDCDTLKSKFTETDIFDPLNGKIDIMYAGTFLHLFNYNKQLEMCQQMVRLLRDKRDLVVLRRQVDNMTAGEHVHRMNKGEKMFRHNEETFRNM